MKKFFLIGVLLSSSLMYGMEDDNSEMKSWADIQEKFDFLVNKEECDNSYEQFRVTRSFEALSERVYAKGTPTSIVEKFQERCWTIFIPPK